MDIVVNRAELLNAARHMAAVAPTDSPVKELSHVLLETDAASRMVSLTATNLEVALREKVPCTVQADGRQIINARLLAAMLEKLPEDSVAIRREGQTQAALESGSASYVIHTLDSNRFPQVELPFPENTVKLNGIPSLVKRTAFATRIDQSRPLLRCVNLMFTKDGLRVAAGNGSCIVTVRCDENCDGNINLLLPVSSLSKLARLCGDKDEFHVGTTGKNIVFFRKHFLFSARLMEGDYIDTDQIVHSTQNRFTVLTDVMELRSTLESTSSVDSGGKVALSFHDNQLEFCCSSAYGNAAASVEVVPLRGVPAGEYWYDAGQLLESLRALVGTAQLGVAPGGMLTISTEKEFYMQTALRAPSKAPENLPRKVA